MKNIFFVIKHTYFPLIVILASLQACRTDNHLAHEGEEALMSISVRGIALPYPDHTTNRTKANIDLRDINTTFMDSRKKTYNGLELIHGSHAGIISTDELINGMNPAMETTGPRQLSATSRAGSRPIVAMKKGVKYRFLLYKADMTFVGSYDLVAGQETKIAYIVGQKYLWCAYSYDSEDPMPIFSPNLTTVTIPTDSPLLYSKGTFQFNEDKNHPLEITFAHQSSRIGVRVDARGMFSKVHTLAATLTLHPFFLHEGTIDLLNGTISTTAEPKRTIQIGDPLTFQAIDGAGEVKAAYYYSVRPELLPTNFGIVVSEFSIEKTDGTIEKLIGTGATYDIDGNLTFGSFPTLEIAKASTGTIELIHGGAPINGLIWAQGNLYYTANDGTYRFRPTDTFNYFNTGPLGQETTAEFRQEFIDSDFWYWMSETPGQMRTDWKTNHVDPCSNVIPKGLWRVPSNADWNKLKDGSSFTIEYGEGHAHITNRVGVFWEKGKTRGQPGVKEFKFKVDGRWNAQYNKIDYPEYALFWSSTMSPEFSNGHMAHYMRFTGTLVQVGNNVADKLEWRRYNIRCVRDAN